MGLYHFPADLEQIIAERASEASVDESPRALAEAVLGLSDLFLGRIPWQAEYGRKPELRSAYLRYFLPVNLPKIRLPLAAWLGASPRRFAGRRLRCLDLGSGPGTALLGLCDFVRELPAEERPASLDLVALDQWHENLVDAGALLARFGEVAPELPPARFQPFRLDLLTDRSQLFPLVAADGPFDLVLAANVLCEIVRQSPDGLEKSVALIESVAERILSPDGAILLVEPGLRETSRDFHRLRDRVLAAGKLHVHAPCLHESGCPALFRERDWCIADVPWQPPRLVAELDRRTGLRKGSLKFSYLVLALDAAVPSARGTWRVVSDVLDLKGERRIYLCAAGRWIVLSQLKRHRGPEAEAFARLCRGDLVEVEGMQAAGSIFRLPPTGSVRRVEDGILR